MIMIAMMVLMIVTVIVAKSETRMLPMGGGEVLGVASGQKCLTCH